MGGYRPEPSFLRLSLGVNGAHHSGHRGSLLPISSWFPQLRRVYGHLDPGAYSGEVISEAQVAVGFLVHY